MGLRKRVILLFCVTLLAAACRRETLARADEAEDPAATKVPIIRVRLLVEQDKVMVAAAEAPTVDVGSGVKRLNFPAGTEVPVVRGPQGWQVGNLALGGGDREMVLAPAADGSVRVNGQVHRGRYRLVPVAQGKFDVINDVDLDSYLKGVLAKEIPERWGEEAFRAQAIAARTYALYEARTSGGQYWDVWADTRSQVYGGIAGESPKARAAAEHTAGIVLAYGPSGHERIFKAYFSACCGGIGQSAQDALGDSDIPPLGAKYVGPLCNASEKFNWPPVVIKKDELTRRIRTWGARRGRSEKSMGRLARIDVAEVNRFGRPVRFQFTDERGARYSLSGEEARWACNADAKGGATLLSSFFKPVSEKDAIRFAEGHGFGHGVGLCQWCTQALSEQGRAHEDILRHAYPGAVLVRAY